MNYYILEKFGNAVEKMATSPLSLRERIINACAEFRVIRKEEMPQDLQWDYEQLIKKITKIKTEGSEVSLGVTTTKISENELIEVAQKILYIGSRLEDIAAES